MFEKATKYGAKLRAALFGPSGAGKTMTALRMARGIVGDAGRIGVIDTEHGSASKYADRFEFDACNLRDRTIEGYIEAIEAARDYDALIIDSISHAWQELVEANDRLAQAKFSGNTWAAWSKSTPKQRAFIEALYKSPCHIFATIRSKTAWEVNKDGNGRGAPQRVGLAPEQGKGIEYEFDLLIELSTDHIANIIKDRTGKYQDQLITKPGEDFGKALAAWLADAPPPPIETTPAPTNTRTTTPSPAAPKSPPQY